MVIKLLGIFVYFCQKITDVRSSFTESVTVMQDAMKKVWLSQPTRRVQKVAELFKQRSNQHRERVAATEHT